MGELSDFALPITWLCLGLCAGYRLRQKISWILSQAYWLISNDPASILEHRLDRIEAQFALIAKQRNCPNLLLQAQLTDTEWWQPVTSSAYPVFQQGWERIAQAACGKSAQPQSGTPHSRVIQQVANLVASGKLPRDCITLIEGLASVQKIAQQSARSSETNAAHRYIQLASLASMMIADAQYD